MTRSIFRILAAIKSIMLIGALTSATAFAQSAGSGRPQYSDSGTFFYGLGVMASSRIYRDDTFRVIPIPLVGYRSDRLTVFGPFVSYNVVKNQPLQIAVQLAPNFDGFDDDDGAIFAGMAKREWSIDAGVTATYNYEGWGISAGFMGDILGRSNGIQLNSQIDYRFRSGSWMITPAIGINYQTANYVDYYYGVKAAEVTPQRPLYNGRATFIPFVDLSVMKNMPWASLRVSFQNKWHGAGITDSPLVRKGSSQSLLFTLSRDF